MSTRRVFVLVDQNPRTLGRVGHGQKEDVTDDSVRDDVQLPQATINMPQTAFSTLRTDG